MSANSRRHLRKAQDQHTIHISEPMVCAAQVLAELDLPDVTEVSLSLATVFPSGAMQR